MCTISVELPSHLLEFVERKVAEGQFECASEYLVALVRAACENRASIEATLMEGINSGPTEEWKSQEWQAIRDRVRDRHK